MKSKRTLDNILIYLLAFLIVINIVYFSKNFDLSNMSKRLSDSNGSEITFTTLKNSNSIIKENKLHDFTAFIVMKNNDYKTYLVSNKTGKEISFDSIIKSDKLNLFWNKVYELLELKYPEFIINGIKSGKGNIYYDIKNNEMIIYFKNYVFNPEYNDLISIRVNYNEVKDYLDFTYELDHEYINENGYDYDKNKKTIAFTFDDGPSGEYTIDIVNELLKNKARATFFMVGSKMYTYEKSLLYAYQNKMEIGSHTYNHINLKKAKETLAKEELEKTDIVYNEITGSNIKLLRPPYGAYNDKTLKNYDYAFITWNIDTNDWRYRNSKYIEEHILSHVADGSVILMHDSYKTTVEAVRNVLPKLYALNYQVVSVSDLAAIKGYTLENHKVYSYFK